MGNSISQCLRPAPAHLPEEMYGYNPYETFEEAMDRRIRQHEAEHVSAANCIQYFLCDGDLKLEDADSAALRRGTYMK